MMVDSLKAVQDSLGGVRIPLSWFVRWSVGGKNPIGSAFIESREPRYMMLVVRPAEQDKIINKVGNELRLPKRFFYDLDELVDKTIFELKISYYQGALLTEAKRRVCAALVESTDPNTDLLSAREVLELYRE